MAEKVSDRPWGDIEESDYTLEQWHRACLIHRFQRTYEELKHDSPESIILESVCFQRTYEELKHNYIAAPYSVGIGVSSVPMRN